MVTANPSSLDLHLTIFAPAAVAVVVVTKSLDGSVPVVVLAQNVG